MADEVRQRLQRVGHLQEKALLWLGDMQQIISLNDLRERWLTNGHDSEPVEIEESYTEYAPYLTEEYFQDIEEPKRLEDEGWVTWSPEKLLGHKPTPLESTSLSKAIRGLEKRELVEIAKVAGKKRRVSYVNLTFYGEVASVLLRTRLEEGD